MINLVVLSSGPVQSIALSDRLRSYMIGRDENCDLVLDDELASRVHAKLRFVGVQWQIEDCGSRNRLKVNQLSTDNEVLVNGDLIRIGDSVILFTDATHSPQQKKRSPPGRDTTTVSRIDMEPSFHPRAGTLIESFAAKNEKQSGLLGKLATLLHMVATEEQLFKLCIKNLRQAMAVRKIRIWLRDCQGRLQLAAQFPASKAAVEPSLYAGLAIENRQGIVFGDGVLDHSSKGDSKDPGAVCAILPGAESVHGVIECIETATNAFAVRDLEYLIAVCCIVGPALNRLEQIQRLESTNTELENNTESGTVVGTSDSIQQLQTRIQQVAQKDTTILITGETGTGKELVAGMIHDQSRRKGGPLITVNCAAFNETLLESELFGHEKGAFTGADRRRIGAFERANEGTLFLDEIGEMSLGCQAKVLRLLEHYPFERVGGSESVNTNVRIVAATHRDLPELVDTHNFRLDLMYRLQVVELKVPPLRDRGDDIKQLAYHFFRHYCKKFGQPIPGFSAVATESLLSYHWPGNVRELRNMMERVAVFNKGEEITTSDFQMKRQDFGQKFPLSEFHSMQEMENRYIRFVMESVAGNKTEACRVLGISRATLYNKLSNTAEDRDSSNPDSAKARTK